MDATYWFMFPIAIVIAAVANGAGIGGATFFSPLMLIVLGLSPEVAIGTALITEVFGFTSGVTAHARASQAGQGQRHRYTVIAVGINGRRAQVVAGNTQIALPCFNVRSQLAQLGFQRSNPIRFLDPEVANVGNRSPTLGEHADHGQGEHRIGGVAHVNSHTCQPGGMAHKFNSPCPTRLPKQQSGQIP